MADSYDRYDNEGSGGGFMMGLLTGTVLGAGLGMLLAPKAGAELRGAIGEHARTWGTQAQEQYRHAREAAGPWVDRGRDMVSQARDAASQAAEQARGYAGAAAEQARGYAGAGATSGTSGTSGNSGFGSTGSGSGSTGSTGATGGNFGGGSSSGSDFNRS
jgi:gas vesicle protein